MPLLFGYFCFLFDSVFALIVDSHIDILLPVCEDDMCAKSSIYLSSGVLPVSFTALYIYM